MITKEEVKKEVDNLPSGLLEEVYLLLKKLSGNRIVESKKLSIRNFNGRLDRVDIRKEANQ